MKVISLGKIGLIIILSLLALFASGCFFDVYENAPVPDLKSQIGTTSTVTPEALPQVGTTSTAQPEVQSQVGTTTTQAPTLELEVTAAGTTIESL